MALTLYDTSLISKLENWTSKTNLHLYSVTDTRKLIETIADEKNDSSIKLPIISIIRQAGYEIINPNKKVLTYDGLLLDANEKKSLNLNAIPINITYQIDVWARKFEEADSYMSNLVFNLINYPTLQITIPYNNSNIIHNATIRIATDVFDSSDINRLSIGQYFRLSVGINIDDAYIWDTRVRDVLSLSYIPVEI